MVIKHNDLNNDSRRITCVLLEPYGIHGNLSGMEGSTGGSS